MWALDEKLAPHVVRELDVISEGQETAILKLVAKELERSILLSSSYGDVDSMPVIVVEEGTPWEIRILWLFAWLEERNLEEEVWQGQEMLELRSEDDSSLFRWHGYLESADYNPTLDMIYLHGPSNRFPVRFPTSEFLEADSEETRIKIVENCIVRACKLDNIDYVSGANLSESVRLVISKYYHSHPNSTVAKKLKRRIWREANRKIKSEKSSSSSSSVAAELHLSQETISSIASEIQPILYNENGKAAALPQSTTIEVCQRFVITVKSRGVPYDEIKSIFELVVRDDSNEQRRADILQLVDVCYNSSWGSNNRRSS